MKIEIVAPNRAGNGVERWSAEYKIYGEQNTRLIQIDSLSGITVLVSRVLVDWYASIGMPPSYSYYIAVPNFNVVTDGFETLQQTQQIALELSARGLPNVDAQTVAQVLQRVEAMF